MSRTTGVAGPSSVAKGRREGTPEARCGSPGETPGDELGVSPLHGQAGVCTLIARLGVAVRDIRACGERAARLSAPGAACVETVDPAWVSQGSKAAGPRIQTTFRSGYLVAGPRE